MKKLSFADAPAVLFEFESTFFEQLKSIQVDGWNIWSICKIPLFYYLISTPGCSDERVQRSLIKRIQSVINSLFKYVKFYSRKEDALFLTYSADKLSKDSNGLFVNAIIHPILELEKFKKPIVIEYPTANGFLEPARFSWHIDGRIIDLSSRIKEKIIKSQIAGSSVQAKVFCTLFNEFLQVKGYDHPVNEQTVERFISKFFSKKKNYYNLFKRRKPTVIVGSELMGNGALAAAIELDIPVIEIQHGAIDNCYPPYVWHKNFSILNKVLKPTKILVFGDFAKNIIIRSGFFKAGEIVPVGYSKIDEVRNQYNNLSFSLKWKVLVVVQPMMHEFNLSLIQQLLKLQNEGYKIFFKAHPLQPESEKRDYEQLLAASNIGLIENKENIHKVIMDSDIVIGHITTCLEEALSLGKPSLTITTEELPFGIHSMTGSDALADAIVPCSLLEIKERLFKYYEDAGHRDSWSNIIYQKKHFLYSAGYLEKIDMFFNDFKSKKQ